MAVIFAIVIVNVCIASYFVHGPMLDFTVFHRAGGRYLRGEELYRLSDGHFAWKYSPTVAAIFAPFSIFPLRVGWVLWNVASLFMLLRVIRWVARQIGRDLRAWEQVMLLGMAAPWYGHLFWLGQSDGLVLFLLVESEARSEARPLASGALWALACLVKPPVLVMGLVVAILRQWKRAAGLVLGTAAWLALGVLRYGTGAMAELHGWRALLSQSTPDLLCNEWNQSAWAMTCTYLAPYGTRAFFPWLVAISASLVAAGLAAVWFVSKVDRARGRFLLFAFALYLGAFLSPLGWNTNLLLAIPLATSLAVVAASGATPWLRRAAFAAACVITFLNCMDLVLLPFHLWPDTALTLLLIRQYALAGLVTVFGATLAVLLQTSLGAKPERALA